MFEKIGKLEKELENVNDLFFVIKRKGVIKIFVICLFFELFKYIYVVIEKFDYLKNNIL